MCSSELCYVSKTGTHDYLSDIDKYVNYSFKFFYCNGQNSLKTRSVLVSVRSPGDPEMNPS